VRGEYNYENGRGGAIGAFWWVCGLYKIAGSTSNNLDMFTRQFFSQNTSSMGKSAPCNSSGWRAWCAYLCSKTVRRF
jgi:hypothetical protein